MILFLIKFTVIILLQLSRDGITLLVAFGMIPAGG
jgi:hypothetical protein